MIPSIEVFILSYNNSQYIESTIKSILHQKSCTILLTVIDDCSTDDSLYLLNMLQKKYLFSLIVNTKNLGVVKNVNHAIKLAKSEYFSIHPSDDISDIGRFSHQLEQLSIFPEVDFIISSMEIMGYRKNQTKLMSNTFDIYDLLNRKVATNISVTYRTSAIKQVVLNENYISEEPQIFYEVLLNGRGLGLKDNFICYRYRMHELNLTSTRMPEMMIQNIELIKNLRNRVDMDLSPYISYLKSIYVSSLAEVSSILAFKEILYDYRILFEGNTIRIIAKILLPRVMIKFFKK
jgi:glycosyltransferase involved in cell wall biosynthesis